MLCFSYEHVTVSTDVLCCSYERVLTVSIDVLCCSYEHVTVSTDVTLQL